MAIADTHEVRSRTTRRCVWLCLSLAVAALIPGIWYAARREYAIRQIRATRGWVEFGPTVLAKDWLWPYVPACACPVERVDYGNDRPDVRSLRVLSELRHFSTSCPQFNDEMLAQLSSLSALWSLELQGTQVSDAGLASIARFRLRLLDLSDTRVTDEGLKHLAGMPLEFLALSGTDVSGPGLEWFKSSPPQTLALDRTKLSDSGLLYLNGMHLDGLFLDETQVTDSGVQHLKVDGLTSLSLNRTRVSGSSATALRSMGLTELNLAGTGFSDEWVRQLANGSLTVLDLRGTQITDIAAGYLETCHNLDDLRLPCPPMTRDCITQLGKKLRLNVGIGANVAIVSFHLGRDPEDWNWDLPEEP